MGLSAGRVGGRSEPIEGEEDLSVRVRVEIENNGPIRVKETMQRVGKSQDGPLRVGLRPAAEYWSWPRRMLCYSNNTRSRGST
jgi:hypothetical protein